MSIYFRVNLSMFGSTRRSSTEGVYKYEVVLGKICGHPFRLNTDSWSTRNIEVCI